MQETAFELLWRRSAVVDLCRTLACDTRLVILGKVAEKEAVTPTGMAETLGLGTPVTSQHIRRLVCVGLVQDLDAGMSCSVRWTRSADRDALAEATRAWLAPLLKDARSAVEQIPVASRPKDWQTAPEAALRQVLFRIATGFCNARRLGLFHHIDTHGPCATGALALAMKIPRPSALWHVGKLVRRGFIEVLDQKNRTRYRVPTRLPSPIHAGFLQIIRGTNIDTL
jgi:DNA-binding transcriptional ArsR family regulator